jgi:hypothetical protein
VLGIGQYFAQAFYHVVTFPDGELALGYEQLQAFAAVTGREAAIAGAHEVS